VAGSIGRRELIALAGRAAAVALVTAPLGITVSRPRSARASTPLDELRRAIAARNGSVLGPGDIAFQHARRDYNLRVDTVPQAIVRCRTTAGVEAAVLWANTHDVPVFVRAGGHSYEGTSVGDGLVVDVGPLATIAVGARGARIGAGARLGACYQAAAARGLALVAGTCGSVGITGLTLGGGHGHLVRAFGLACDQVRSVKLVDARGATVTASASENADLFWALRGAGGGAFGIVTELEVALHPVTRVVTWSYSWLPRQAARVFAAWQAWIPELPDGASTVLKLDAAVGRGLTGVECLGTFVPRPGETPTTARVQALLRPLTATAAPTSTNVHARTFASTLPSANDTGQPVRFKGKSDILTAPLSPSAIETLVDAMGRIETGVVAMMADAYRGAVGRVATDATAFVHRDALACVQWYTQWPSAGQTASRLAMMRSLYARVHPLFSGAAYVNYCDADLPDGPRAYFGSHLERLQVLKRTLDPKNRFRSNFLGVA